MNFKKYNRVEYRKNTLFEVVFQARFPAIFKIEKETPVEFQDTIRKLGYPESRTNKPVIPTDLPEEFGKVLTRDAAYIFFSEIKDWQITLSKDSIALSCLGHYSNYTEFSEKLNTVLEIFHDLYKPSYYNRVGLRYRNIINKAVLNNANLNIRDCIPNHIAPELDLDIKNSVSSFEKYTLYKEGQNKTNLLHSLVVASGKFGKHQINEEESYIIDIDCFSEHKIREVDRAITKSREFNDNVRNIFRWSITDKLHKAMEPITV